MAHAIDLTDQKFSRLIVIKRVENRHNKVAWLCKCKCSNTKVIISESLKNGLTTSCGCKRKETSAENGKKSAIHGLSNDPLFKTWNSIKKRCYTKKSQDYKYYGGRNKNPIKMSKSWYNSFEQFAKDMGTKPKNLTIERKNNDKGYCKSNCKWATRKEQNNNSRNNHLITYKGKTLNIAQWAEKLNINYATLYMRLCVYKWKIERALNKPARAL